MREFNKKTKLPYTPILLVLGIVASLCGDHIGMISNSTSLIAQIEPSGILLIFIPILIFESSFNADWFIFKKSLKQILLLAGPGVAISFGMIAFTLKIILGYDDLELSWSSALMVGAILAATDPVAIVALLKDLRAPMYFSTIVEGESLLNDGTGVVFFTIFSNLAAGNKVSVGVGIGAFSFLCFGGVALGLVFSVITSTWLEKIFDDSILSISITISSSYLLYWVAETFTAYFTGDMKVGVSGILALCTMGLYLSAYGKVKISNRVEHPLHTVIQWTQYVSETLIFLLAGILVGKIFIAEEKTLHASDWWKLIVFFILLNVIRGLLIAMFSPLLKRFGTHLSLKELFILSYAGLRGALGISLALTVNANTEKFSARTRELVLFYVAGTAALSLLINGTTTGLLVKKIKMVNVFPAKEKIFRAFNREISAYTEKQYEKLRDENSAAICDWDTVQKITGGFNDDGLKGLRRTDSQVIELNEVLSSGTNTKSKTKKYLSYTVQVNEEELRLEARCRILQIAKGLIWERYEHRQLEAYGANILNKAVSVSLDSLNKRVNLFDFIEMYFEKPSVLSLYSKLAKIPLAGRFFKNQMVNNMIFIYDVNTSLIEVTRELKSHAEHIPIQPYIINSVLEEFNEGKKKASEHLSRLEDQFLSIIKYITTKRHVTKILMAQRQFLTERYVRGILEAKEFDKLSGEIDKKLQNLSKLLKVKWEAPTFSNFITTYPILNMLPQGDMDKITQSSKKVMIKQGQNLFTEGEEFDGVYLITKGEVEMTYNEKISRRGVGHLISFMNLATEDCISRMSCFALHEVEAQKLSVKVLKEIMKENSQFEERIYKEAFMFLRFMKPRKAQELVRLSEHSVQVLMRNSDVLHFKKGDVVRLTCGAFVFSGSLLKKKKKVYEEYDMIPRNERILTGFNDGVLIKFNSEIPLIRRKSSVEKLDVEHIDLDPDQIKEIRVWDE